MATRNALSPCLKKPLSGPPLDKLAQPRNCRETLRKRARAKAFNYGCLGGLLRLNSPLHKQYKNAAFCVTKVHQIDGKLTSNYCNSRACMVCNRIRTGKLINGYEKPLQELNSPHFVTLTKPTVQRSELKASIDEMIKAFIRIKDRLRKRGIKINGIRKLECTYNHKRNWYHAHFHFVIDGQEIAEILLGEWLKEYPKAKAKAQDVRPADKETIKELFKYVCKPPIKKDGSISTIAFDVILQALFARRVVQPFGNLRKHKVSEDVDELDAIIITDDTRIISYVWVQEITDWIDYSTGELLSGYTPSLEDLPFIKKPPT